MKHPGLRLAAALLAILAIAPGAVAGADPEPVRPADFVALRDVDPSILQDMRYSTPHNFTGAPVDGYLAPTCILTRPAAEALARAQREFVRAGIHPQGLRLLPAAAGGRRIRRLGEPISPTNA